MSHHTHRLNKETIFNSISGDFCQPPSDPRSAPFVLKSKTPSKSKKKLFPGLNENTFKK